MAYNEQLAARVRDYMAKLPNVEEKKMMGGITFMYNDKMCVGVKKDELMCRIDPDIHDEVAAKPGCRSMDMSAKTMRGFVMVSLSALDAEKDFAYYMGLSIDFNAKAASSKSKKK
ncbi:MAG: TfoX family protein [Chitinophagia bacterium]|nr:TfoX family protein [Chitinophagia bacterium]